MNRRGFLFSLSALSATAIAATAITLGRKSLPAPEPEPAKSNRFDEHGCEVYWIVEVQRSSRLGPEASGWWIMGGMHELRAGDHFRMVDPHTGAVLVDKFADMNDDCKATLTAEGRVKAEYTLHRVIGSPFTTATSTGGKTWGVQSMPVA